MISEEQAKEIARKECESRGRAFMQPIHIKQRPDRWIVTTNADSVGGNVRVAINKQTGEVITFSFAPR
jgi:hypothetical protein